MSFNLKKPYVRLGCISGLALIIVGSAGHTAMVEDPVLRLSTGTMRQPRKLCGLHTHTHTHTHFEIN